MKNVSALRSANAFLTAHVQMQKAWYGCAYYHYTIHFFGLVLSCYFEDQGKRDEKKISCEIEIHLGQKFHILAYFNIKSKKQHNSTTHPSLADFWFCSLLTGRSWHMPPFDSSCWPLSSLTTLSGLVLTTSHVFSSTLFLLFFLGLSPFSGTTSVKGFEKLSGTLASLLWHINNIKKIKTNKHQRQ